MTAFFADGLAASTDDNVLSKEGVATAIELTSDTPTTVNYIQGFVRIPQRFQCVKTLEFLPSLVTFVSTTGARVSTPMRHEFLNTGKP